MSNLSPAQQRNREHQFTFHAEDGPLFEALQKLRNDTSRNFSGAIRMALEKGLRKQYPELFKNHNPKNHHEN